MYDDIFSKSGMHGLTRICRKLMDILFTPKICAICHGRSCLPYSATTKLKICKLNFLGKR